MMKNGNKILAREIMTQVKERIAQIFTTALSLNAHLLK